MFKQANPWKEQVAQWLRGAGEGEREGVTANGRDVSLRMMKIYGISGDDRTTL